jgi:UDP-GlcNAc:undecaprenyl-phosphate GlcNAc-1-phosphate transferase
MPAIISIARSHNLYDEVNERKIHTGKIPRLGGIGIVLAFVIALVVSTLVFGSGGDTGGRLVYILFSAFTIHLLGLVDDFSNLKAVFKFTIELGIAILLSALGFRFRTVLIPFGSGSIDFGLLSWPLTVVWIIGITNAVNLIDGMDGLSGGISLLASLAYGAFFLARGNAGSALVCFALVGAIGGFLVFNLPPAKIFMGDSGSLALGFILSLLPLLGPANGVIEIGFISAVTVLLIPIYDTFSAMIRRWSKGVSFFMPDKLHLHHKLLSLGLSSRGALAVIYLAQLFLDAMALTPFFMDKTASFILRIGTWIFYALLFVLLARVVARRINSPEGPENKGAHDEPRSLGMETSIIGAAFGRGPSEK